MRGSRRNIAIFLALCALVVTGVARTAEARGTGSAVGAAAAKLSRGAQIRMSRMKQKMALRTRGAQQQKSKRQLKLSKRQMQRAMSRRENGLRTSETDRVRARFARDIDDPADHAAGMESHGAKGGSKDDDVNRERNRKAVVRQIKTMRERAKARAHKDFRKLRRNRPD